ncbi:MAG: hypothetical protein ACON38_15925 [Akkermansiaceae bacterium]
MNTTNILLGTTTLLLVVALTVTFGGFTNSKDSDEARLQRKAIEAEIARTEAEAEALRLETARLTATPYVGGDTTPVVATTPRVQPLTPTPTESELAEQLQEERKKNADLEVKLETSKAETEAVLEEKNKIKAEQERRANKIRQSLLMGTVTNSDKTYGQVIFRPTASANFQPGTVLAIRRNQGIVGRIVVDRFDQGMYICTMRPNGYSPDGFPDIVEGDEVIFDHGFK